jgi:hypothetical protein
MCTNRVAEFFDMTDSHNVADLHLLEKRVSTKRQEVARLIASFEELQISLQNTRVIFYARVGHLYVELESLELAIRKEKFRQELKEIESLTEERIDQLVSEKFQKKDDDIVKLKDKSNNCRSDSSRLERFDSLSTETLRIIKNLYLKLARKFHPDLNGVEFKNIMSKVNESYNNLDLQGLIDIQDGVMITVIEKYETAAERRVRLERVLLRLERLEAGYLQNMKLLEQNDIYELHQMIETGRQGDRDALEEIAIGLNERIESGKHELEIEKRGKKNE